MEGKKSCVAEIFKVVFGLQLARIENERLEFFFGSPSLIIFQEITIEKKLLISFRVSFSSLAASPLE